MTQNKTNSECFEYQTCVPGRQYIDSQAQEATPQGRAQHTHKHVHTHTHTMYDAQQKELPNNDSPIIAPSRQLVQ
jgi:hypothetical protein